MAVAWEAGSVEVGCVQLSGCMGLEVKVIP